MTDSLESENKVGAHSYANEVKDRIFNMEGVWRNM